MDLLVDAVATYRLTRLVVQDDITAPLRAKVRHAAMRQIDSPGIASKIDTLISCPWCVSMWIAGGVYVARRAAPRAWAPLAAILVCSATSGLLAENT